MSERAAAGAERPPAQGLGLPGPAFGVAFGVALAVFFGLVGAFAPEVVPSYVGSAREVTGMALMLTLVPPYIVIALWLGQRRSFALVEELRPRLPDARAADAALETMRTALRRNWPRGVVLGVVLGLLNTQPHEALRSDVPVIALALSSGQLVLWQTVGQLAVVRVAAARSFRRLAELVPVELLRPDRQRPLTRAGVIDVAIIAGAILFTPLQSLDAEFRWYNYHFGLLVGLPAAAFYVLWPLAPLHRRNREERDARLTRLDRQLAAHSADVPATAEEAARLEALLAHHDRLRSARVWPLGRGLASRVLLYLVIPPLAWAGAALVERAVDRLLG